MKEFRVIAEMTVRLQTIIEANSQDEAESMVLSGIDGGDFAEIENSGAWEIVSVTQVE